VFVKNGPFPPKPISGSPTLHQLCVICRVSGEAAVCGGSYAEILSDYNL